MAYLRCVGVAACLGVFAAVASAAQLLDGDEDFKLMASEGFTKAVDGPHAEGSTQNDYAWSMAWFKGKLYVGTGRFQTNGASPIPTASQIWAYTPGGADGSSGTWALAFTAPQSLGVPREVGYRWMTQCSFQGKDYLFVSTIGPVQGNVLYTLDGVTFNTVSRTGIPGGSIGFRALVCFTEQSGRQVLAMSPVGRLTPSLDSDLSNNPLVLANADPTGSGTWQAYSAVGMGDANNESLFSLTAFNGWLYAGTMNEVSGAQVWKSRGCAAVGRNGCTPSWTKVLDRGGGRPPSSGGIVGNMGVSDLVGFGSAVYVGLTEPAFSGNFVKAELMRIRSDDTIEVLVGEPRLGMGTNAALPPNLRCGLPLEDIDHDGAVNDCPPTTRRGAGYAAPGDATNGYPSGTQLYFWRLYPYARTAATPLGDDRLYAGTLDGTGLGFQILASDDGTHWTTVTADGLGFWQQQGMRSIAASPYGLFVGGTHFAVGYAGEVLGCNVWLGSPLPDSVAPITTLASPPSPAEGASLAVRSATFQWAATDPAPPSLPIAYAYRLDPIEPAFSTFGAATTKTYDMLANGTYTFYVVARDAAGNVEAPGAAPGAGNRRTFSVSAPDLPPSVTITVAPSSPNTNGAAFFTWTGSDDVTPAANLAYDRWLDPLQTDPGTFAPGTSASYGSLPNGSYTFHVLAKDGAGNLSAPATATFTVAVPSGPPGVPAPASATLIGPRTVHVAWANVAGETRYVVQRCAASRGCYYATIAPNVAADTTQLDDFVDPGSGPGNFGYQVQACNSVGCSGWATTPLVNVP